MDSWTRKGQKLEQKFVCFKDYLWWAELSGWTAPFVVGMVLCKESVLFIYNGNILLVSCWIKIEKLMFVTQFILLSLIWSKRVQEELQDNRACHCLYLCFILGKSF